MKCSASFCDVVDDVQYVLVRNNSGSMTREYLCQKHLRKRIYMLMLLSEANKIRDEIKGWYEE